MRGRSIRLRLWSAAVVSIVIALGFAGVGLRYLFERHVERRIEVELTVQLTQLIAATTRQGDAISVSPSPTDPRFFSPLSGFYWQVEDLKSGTVLRSRSLWDGQLALPPAAPAGRGPAAEEITGPDGDLLVALERTVTDPDGLAFRAVVAETHSTVEESLADFTNELVPALVLFAVVLIGANFIQIGIGLAPLEALRRAVREVLARRRSRLHVAAPQEVQPLADEIDRLLEAQEKAVVRARSRATDLAHGLKTPLQVLSADIRVLRNTGAVALADNIEKSVLAIRRHIERELARARLAPGIAGHVGSEVAGTAAQVIEVVRRTPKGKLLTFSIDVPPGMTVPLEEGDLTEILGNLLENAARYAETSVSVSVAKDASETVLAVTDDGPGLPDSDKTSVVARGIRLEARRESTGLGLAIVSDIAEAYGGRLVLADAQPHGLSVSVVLPRVLGEPREKIDLDVGAVHTKTKQH